MSKIYFCHATYRKVWLCKWVGPDKGSFVTHVIETGPVGDVATSVLTFVQVLKFYLDHTVLIDVAHLKQTSIDRLTQLFLEQENINIIEF